MRQTLLRFVSDFWAWRTAPGQLDIGIGYLILVWTAYGLWWLARRIRKSERNELLTGVITWVVVTAVLAWLPRTFIDGVPVYGYGFMLFVGFMVAGFSGTRRARSVGVPEEYVWDVGIWIFFSGILGARLFYLAQYHQRVFAGTSGMERIKAAVNLSDGGLVFYGGVILGTLAYLVYCRRRRVSPLLMGDIAMPSIFIGLAFGRVGCFLNGCCFGDRCDLPWAVSFPQESLPWTMLVNRGFLSPEAAVTFPLHPTQLYSVINALVLAWLTAVVFRYRHRNGTVIAVGFLIYPLTRMVIELLRGDEMGQFGTRLTISQWVSLALAALSVAYLVYLLRSPNDRATTVAQPALGAKP